MHRIMLHMRYTFLDSVQESRGRLLFDFYVFNSLNGLVKRLWCLSTVFIQIQRSPQIRWSSRSWLPGSARPSSWSATPTPYEKKKLGVLDIYSKYPYLIQSAIDYEVCLQADTFEGDIFSTFSSLIVLQRTMRMDRAQDCEGSTVASYAYNIEGPAGEPKRWATNMSDLSLAAISYGSNEVSCQ